MNDFPGSDPFEGERVRRLLEDSVSDVEPRPSLDEIRSRTAASGSSRRPWIWAAGAAVVATAATVTAVAVMGGSPGTTAAPDPGFADGSPIVAGPEEPGDGSSSQADPVTVPVYYVGETGQGPRLFRELASTSAGPNLLPDVLSQAVSRSPRDSDYRNPWPAGTELNHAERTADLIVVDLNSGTDVRPAGMSTQEAATALQQLIYTAQSVTRSQMPVQFLLDDEIAETVLGVATSDPLHASDPSEALAQVWILEPAEGAQVPSGFEVTGLANAFEANVQWELMQGDQVVRSGFTTAEECCTMAPYSFTVKAPPGDYTLVVHDSDPSDGEGFPPWQDTKNITVVE